MLIGAAPLGSMVRRLVAELGMHFVTVRVRNVVCGVSLVRYERVPVHCWRNRGRRRQLGGALLAGRVDAAPSRQTAETSSGQKAATVAVALRRQSKDLPLIPTLLGANHGQQSGLGKARCRAKRDAEVGEYVVQSHRDSAADLMAARRGRSREIRAIDAVVLALGVGHRCGRAGAVVALTAPPGIRS